MAVLKWPTFWAPKPQKLTRKKIRKLAAPGEYDAGRTCYQQGDVTSAFIRRNLAWATVRDNNATYMVVSTLDGYWEPYCPCGRKAYALTCRHGVAALLYVTDAFSEMIQHDLWKDVKATISPIPAEALRKFVADVPAGPGAPSPRATDAEMVDCVVEMVRNSGESRDLFAARFGEPDLADHRECRVEMSYMFDLATRMYPAPRVGLADMFKAAKAREARDDINGAILTYREISEAVENAVEEIEDEDGYYFSSFSKALDKMATCIRRRLREPGQRRPHIEYLHGRLAAEQYSWYFKKYQDAVLRICDNREDLAYLGYLHRTHMEKARSTEATLQEDMLAMQKAILSKLGSMDPGKRPAAKRNRATHLSYMYQMDKARQDRES